MGKAHILKPGGGSGGAAAAGGGEGGEGGGGSAKGIEAMLAAEVAELRDVKHALFRWHATGVPNTIFVIFPKGKGAGSREGARATSEGRGLIEAGKRRA
jgi:hypothetical protein